jgi:DMSO/TMAO reductase YedYZ molybdopterin-dependent catalytic subunit
MNGLVSNGAWSGVALAPLLRECGILPEAREVVFFGADVEKEAKWPAAGREYTAPHGRSLFVQDALESNAILATHLNGEPLTMEHGYPLRLLVPGWYGMAQVKWLNRIVVLDRRYEGRHMARNYHSLRQGGDGLVLETSIGRNRLKSVVARIEDNLSLHGAAWGGVHPIERVEVRADEQPWKEASIVERSGGEGWILWRFDWRGATPGVHTIVSRAIDSRGNIQPERSEMVSAREDNSQWIRRVRIG